jgi:hypothetical protein
MLFLLCVFVFKEINNKSIIGILLDIAGYTYGPLLGLFTFGICTKRSLTDKYVPIVCLAAPLVCFALQEITNRAGGYRFGIEMLIVNGALTFAGLWLISRPHVKIS